LYAHINNKTNKKKGYQEGKQRICKFEVKEWF
jgi:hypothetical protein